MTPEQIQQLRQQYGYNPSTLNLNTQGSRDVQSDEVNKRLQTVFGGTQENSTPSSNSVLDFGKGLVKSVGNTANNINRMAEPVMNAIDVPLNKIAQKITGTTDEQAQKALESQQAAVQADMLKREELAKTQNTAQEVGKVTGDIAQYALLPEAKGATAARVGTNFVTGAGLNAAQGGTTGENIIAGGLNAIVPEAGNIVTAIKGLKQAKKEQALIDLVSPRLTPSVAAETKVTNPEGMLGTIKEIVPQRVKDVASAVQDVVNPTKSFSENKNLVQKAIGTEAENLKSTLKTIKYDGQSLRDILKKSVNNIEIPELIKTGDKTVKNQAKAIVGKLNTFIDKAVTDSADLSQGLDARQLFDKYVLKEFPKAFDDVANARNILIKNARTALNQTLDTLAQNQTVSNSLKLQNLMYDALDTISEKVAKGELRTAGEIGSNIITRAIANNPKKAQAAKYIGGGVAAGLVGTGALNSLKGIVGD